MERLRNLIGLNPDLLSDQMAIECLILELSDEQADRLAQILVTYMREAWGRELQDPGARVLH